MTDEFRDTTDSIKAAMECQHIFQSSERSHVHQGLRGKCVVCGFKFTSWPGGIHYDELARVEGAKLLPQSN